MVTIFDIAREAKCSVASFSKVLNNYSDVSQKTRDSVHAAVEKLNYFPNSNAVSLVTNRSYNIGILLLGSEDVNFVHGFFGEILSSFKKEMEKHGYDLTFMSEHGRGFEDSYLKHYLSRKLDGVFAVSGDLSDGKFRELFEAGVPMVCIDSGDERSTDITSDNVRSMRDAVRRVADAGYTDIAYVTGQDVSVMRRRLKGFLGGAKTAGLTIKRENIIIGNFYDMKTTFDLVSVLLRRTDRPQLIFLPDDHSALGAYEAARTLNLRIPDDVAFVGFDGSHIAPLLNPSLTTIRQDVARLGASAAQLLLQRINGAERSSMRRIATQFIPGGSVRWQTKK